MIRDEQTQADTGELLEDIQYVNQLNQAEIKFAKKQIRQCIKATPLPGAVTDSLVNEMSTQLGQLAAKVKLTEKAIHSLQSRQNSESFAWSASEWGNGNPKPTGLRFTPSETTSESNLNAPEFSVDGRSFCWSSADPLIRFSVNLDRYVDLEMRIRIFALIKPMYLRRLKIRVNGKHLKHLYGLDGSLFVVSCVLPAASTSKQTLVEISLPDTHSPMELGDGNDSRKLGLAFTDISFSEPEIKLVRILRFFRLLSRYGVKNRIVRSLTQK